VRAILAARLSWLRRLLFFVALLFAAFFFTVLALLEAEWREGAAVSPLLCPATGNTAISTESKPARHRDAMRVTKAGEVSTLISSL
jgi:hypothetical protein